MYCRNCGKQQYDTEGNYCNYCGAPLSSTTPHIQSQRYETQIKFEDVNKIIQTLLSIALSIFALLNIIAIFLPLIEDDNETVLNLLKENYGRPWAGLVASIAAMIVICICWKSKTTGFPATFVFALIVMVFDIVLISRWKKELGADYWFGSFEEQEGVGFVFYNIGSIAIPICAVLKTILDVIASKFKSPDQVNTHLSHLMLDEEIQKNGRTQVSPLDEMIPENMWECEKCGRRNYQYVGTCACGKNKSNF